MNLRHILAGPFLKVEAQRIANWVGNDEQRLARLLDLMMGQEEKIAARAAWALNHWADHYPSLIAPHLEKLLQYVERKDPEDAVKRNCLRILSKQDLPERLWGPAADLGFRYLADPGQKAAVRVFAMALLGRICREVPELGHELLLTIDEYWDHATPAFRAQGRKIRKALR